MHKKSIINRNFFKIAATKQWNSHAIEFGGVIVESEWEALGKGYGFCGVQVLGWSGGRVGSVGFGDGI